MAFYFVSKSTGNMKDVMYVDYEYACGNILNAHGLGKRSSFPLLKNDVEIECKYTTAAQRVFKSTYTVIKTEKGLSIISNKEGYLSQLFLTSTYDLSLGNNFAFLYQLDGICSEGNIDIIFECNTMPSKQDLENLSNAKLSLKESHCVSNMSDLSRHDLLAENFTVNYYE